MTPNSSRTVELRLRAAVESAPSGLLMIDPEGRIVLVNREVERLFGYSREELLGKSVELLIPERFRHSHAHFRGGFFAEPRVRAMGAGRDLFGRRKDGTEVPVEIGLTPVVTEEGLFVLSSIVDITARKRAEERFRIAVESSPNGMVMSDEDGRIVLVNREVERMFGYAREDLLGRSIEMLVPERFRGRHPGFRQGFFLEPRAREMGAGRDLYGLRRDGSEIPVEIGLNPIETDGGMFVLSSIVDISARRQEEEKRRTLEEQLRQAQKMEAVGTLAGGIAHDFNNILGAILGYAELALGGLPEPRARSDIGEIIQAAERGKRLVQHILVFSRRQSLQRLPLPMDRLVDEGLKLLRPGLPANVDIRSKVAPDAPRILADSTSIHQVLMNLVTNGTQAMPDGGVLELTVEPFYVRDRMARSHPDLHEGSYVVLRVSDSGHGMDRAIRERAFEPFFTTKPAGSGTGLGLAVVHGIMKEHEGAVELESEPGQGTEVRCYFPALVTPVEERPEPGSVDVPKGRGQRVLFVEDQASLALLNERRLQALGYRPTVVMDPRQAIAIFRERPGEFDLVITDYSMPHMSGLEVAGAVKEVRPDLPVLMLTGFVEDLPEEALRESGVGHLLRKPVTLLELAVGIHAIFAARDS